MMSRSRWPLLLVAGLASTTLLLGCIEDGEPTIVPDGSPLCGTCGTEACGCIDDLFFVPVNDPARDRAAVLGEPTQLTLTEIAEDETVAGILLFGTAGWCTFCQTEGVWLVEVYESFQNLPGGRRIEMVAVIFQDEGADTATPEYGEAYAARRGFPFPAVVDPTGLLLNYFDASAAPGNIFVRIEADDMVIQQALSGWDQAMIETNLDALDGPSSCE